MTEVETARKILEQGHCNEVHCEMCNGNDHCPACRDRECLARRLNKMAPSLSGGVLDSKGRKFFEDFLKSKEAKGMDKEEAIKRLDALEGEAAKLREIIERGDGLVYDDNKIYVAIIEKQPYLLCGKDIDDYFGWHNFSEKNATERTLGSSCDTGQGALDDIEVDSTDIHVFDNPKDGIKFFYDQYMKAH